MPIHRIGFTELTSTSNDSAGDGPYRANILFVHGLRGHPRHTWEDNSRDAISNNAEPTKRSKRNIISFFKHKSSTSTTNNKTNIDKFAKVFWPEDFLIEDLPKARVWTYGYNADVIGGLFQANNQNSVSQHGRDLAVRVEREIENEDPIIFVVHSLGGIIVKDAIRRSNACRARTKSIVFLGTPHRGSRSAPWGEIASNFARLALQDSNKGIITTLEVHSEILDNIHEEFKTIADHSRIKIHSFQEARGISGMKGLHNKVVSDFSSKLDLPSSLETVESIDANHMQMARCSDRADPRYRAIVGVLRLFMRSMELDQDRNGPREERPTTTLTATQAATSASEPDGASQNRAVLPSFHISLPRNKRFIGREKILDTLKRMFFIQECQKVAIIGLGGVGKTQIALNFAYWVKENKPNFSIFWVPAISHASFEQTYTEMAKKLCIRRENNANLMQSVRQYLCSEEAGRWLLIVDNADDVDMLWGTSDTRVGIVDYIPDSESGLILFTTRYRDVAVDFQLIGDVNVSKGPAPRQRVTKKFLSELTYLPLAITQAAAYLNRNQISIAEYLGLLRGTEQDMARLLNRQFPDNTRYKGSQNAVATTWLVSFKQIRKCDSAAADLLSFMSCIEPKAIPQSLLPRSDSNEEMMNAIGTLRGFSFLVKRDDDETFDMHSLVHLATRIWIEQERLATKTMEKAICHLNAVFPSDEHENRSLWRSCLPHAFAVLYNNTNVDIKEKYELALRIGQCLLIDGRITEAVGCLEVCHSWRISQFPEEHPDRLTSEHELATAYLYNGQTKQAITLLENVVAIEEKTLVKEHPDRLHSQHELARAYLYNGQAKQAITLLENVVAMREKTLAKEHPDRLASQYVLARAHSDYGQIK